VRGTAEVLATEVDHRFSSTENDVNPIPDTARSPAPAQTFSYDANDRITTETYDLNGNILGSEADTFLYDFEGRLVQINGGVGIAYDAMGNIASRSEGGITTKYVVDEVSPTRYTQVVEEVESGTVSKIFAFGAMPLRMQAGSVASNYVNDGHEDVRLLTNASGAVTDQYDYDGFGIGTRTVGSLPPTLGGNGFSTKR